MSCVTLRQTAAKKRVRQAGNETLATESFFPSSVDNSHAYHAPFVVLNWVIPVNRERGTHLLVNVRDILSSFCQVKNEQLMFTRCGHRLFSPFQRIIMDILM